MRIAGGSQKSSSSYLHCPDKSGWIVNHLWLEMLCRLGCNRSTIKISKLYGRLLIRGYIVPIEYHCAWVLCKQNCSGSPDVKAWGAMQSTCQCEMMKWMQYSTDDEVPSDLETTTSDSYCDYETRVAEMIADAWVNSYWVSKTIHKAKGSF